MKIHADFQWILCTLAKRKSAQVMFNNVLYTVNVAVNHLEEKCELILTYPLENISRFCLYENNVYIFDPYARELSIESVFYRYSVSAYKSITASFLQATDNEEDSPLFANSLSVIW